MAERTEGRVRFCLACGEAVDYERRSCPSCGHHEPLARAPDAGPDAPCPACGSEVPERLVFCPTCGVERGYQRPGLERLPGPGERPPTAGLFTLLVVLTVVGPLALGVAALLLAR